MLFLSGSGTVQVQYFTHGRSVLLLVAGCCLATLSTSASAGELHTCSVGEVSQSISQFGYLSLT